MTSSIFFFLFIPLLAFILLAINFIFAPHNPYQEKNGAFECGFTSFLGQNRTQFSISFFIFALLFLLFDLEILLVYPYLVSSYTNESYGLVVLLIFLLALTLGFVFELGKKALTIDSRQTINSKASNLHINTAKIFSSQDIRNDTISYIISYVYNEIMTYLYSILESFMEMFLDRLANLLMIIYGVVSKSPYIVFLCMQLSFMSLVTLTYSAYYDCINEYIHIIAATFVIVVISLYIAFSKNFKNSHPIIHKYLEILLIICMVILSFYLLSSIFLMKYHVKGGSKDTSAKGGIKGGTNGGGNGGGPNDPRPPYESSTNPNHDQDDSDSDVWRKDENGSDIHNDSSDDGYYESDYDYTQPSKTDVIEKESDIHGNSSDDGYYESDYDYTQPSKTDVIKNAQNAELMRKRRIRSQRRRENRILDKLFNPEKYKRDLELSNEKQKERRKLDPEKRKRENSDFWKKKTEYAKQNDLEQYKQDREIYNEKRSQERKIDKLANPDKYKEISKKSTIQSRNKRKHDELLNPEKFKTDREKKNEISRDVYSINKSVYPDSIKRRKKINEQTRNKKKDL